MEKLINIEFPQLNVLVNGVKLTYLDSAATTLKSKRSIQRLSDFYLYEASNVHRGAHKLSEQATRNYEDSRVEVQKFIDAKSPNEIVFTRGTTESINLVAHSLGLYFSKMNIEEGTILLTEIEHHSNIVPWQQIKNLLPQFKIEYVKISDDGDLDLNDLKIKLTSEVKVLSFSACSNALGTINAVKEICSMAKKAGIFTLVDAAQWVAAKPTSVQDFDCDFLVFSGHKIFAPFGVGVLYGRENLLNLLPPYQGGGSMIEKVSEQESSFLNSPQKFEAGTPNVGGVLALAEALNFVNEVGFKFIENKELALTELMKSELLKIPGVKIIGNPNYRSNIISFLIDGAHHSDIGTLLDKQGIALRVGHHCCQPLMRRLGITGTARVALSIYSQEEDINTFINSLKKAKDFLI